MYSKKIFFLTILFFVANCYILQKCQKKIKNVEKFSASPEIIKEQISRIYKADIESIRNLSHIADKLQGKGKHKNKRLVLPGNLEIKDSLTVGRKATIKGSFNYLPRGTIVIYNGTKAPAGWAMCNGKNGTPDLRGRFVYGYGARSGRRFNRSGGGETHKLSVMEMPRHGHSSGCATFNAGRHNHGYTRFPGHRGNIAAGRYWRATNSRTSLSGNHSHRCRSWVISNGGSRAHNNMPPYRVLSYIMKL